MKHFIIVILSIGAVHPSDTLLTRNNMLFPGELIELTETHAVFHGEIYFKPQKLPLKVVQYISTGEGQLIYGERPLFDPKKGAKNPEIGHQPLMDTSGLSKTSDSTRNDHLILVNGDILSGELLTMNSQFVQFKERPGDKINNLPLGVVRQIQNTEGDILYPQAKNQSSKQSLLPSNWSTFQLLPGQKILLVLESAEAKEVIFHKFSNDSLFFGDAPYSSVPLSYISSLWSEGLDISAVASGSSCGLAGGLSTSTFLLIIYIESIIESESDISLIALAAVPIGAAYLGGKRAARNPTWQLIYRPTIPGSGWDYEQGRERGKKLAKAKPTWFLPGFFYNFWAVETSRNLVPCPPVSEMMDKSKPYIAGLIDGYSEQASLYNTIYSSTGCVLGTAAACFGVFVWGLAASHSN